MVNYFVGNETKIFSPTLRDFIKEWTRTSYTNLFIRWEFLDGQVRFFWKR